MNIDSMKSNSTSSECPSLWLVDGGLSVGFQEMGNVYVRTRLDLALRRDEASARYEFKGHPYELDLTKMTQRNLKTGTRRTVVRLELQSDCAILSRDMAISFNKMDDN